MLGIAAPASDFRQIRDFLVSAGWSNDDVIQISHPNDAAAVRLYGGLVVHIERAGRPRFDGNITALGLDCHAGDFVLEGACHPGEYLPRLVAKLTRLDGYEPERLQFERWRPRKIAKGVALA